MGKISKKRNENEQVEIETKSKKIKISKSEKSVPNKVISEIKRKNKIKSTFVKNQIELHENAIQRKNKNKNMDVSVPSENQDLISCSSESNSIGEILQNVEGIDGNKQKSKKRKKIIATEIDEDSFEKNIVIPSKKTKKKKIRQTITKEVNKEEEPIQETLNINSKKINKKNKNISHEQEEHNGNKETPKKKLIRKIVEQETVDDEKIDNTDEEPVLESLNIINKNIKKKTKNRLHEDEQCLEKNTNNCNKETPKKKKKRKVVEQETVDDEEIDKFCDELDEFQNQQYENWVKLIEKSLSKK